MPAGDETHQLGAASELEIVTKPFVDSAAARTALTVAAQIAVKLAEGGKRDLTFDQGTAFAGGRFPDGRSDVFAATAVPRSRFVDPVDPARPDVTNKIFDFTDDPFTQDVHAVTLNLPSPQLPAQTLVSVNADSPRSAFLALHRTDFHAMYRSLPRFDRDMIAALDISAAIWPEQYGGSDHRNIFPLPYRADPLVRDVTVRIGAPPVEKNEWVPRGLIADRPARWSLISHGPTIRQWWTSVLAGDETRQNVVKDAASRPPGHRGRDRRYLADFPDPTVENKADFYGMGAFPMDVGATADDPLAVYEIRAFVDDASMPSKAELTLDKWGTVADVFFAHYVLR
ncbi:hypothetical protein FAIPA1_10533 [Frankia sp. AiPs1]|uniref:hypothetical protein n=1 Tax=Frankia sp. AiPa1 TaxID=573492 RepID=UPI00202B857D|nr:hypothetical protein [Frankia sp. AiPa1]MCL9758101.1 hypothetical protein [Frankia sp. AiPa1]